MTETTSDATLDEMLDTVGAARTPDFYLIGPEKCGSTWLWSMLAAHPEIGLPIPKEVRYFTALYQPQLTPPKDVLFRDLLTGRFDVGINGNQVRQLLVELRRHRRSDAAYLRIFGQMEEACVGDPSPQYAALPRDGVEHMRAVAPEAKAFMVLRDPVARAISGGKMVLSEQEKDLSDDALLTAALGPFQRDMTRYRAIHDLYTEVFGSDFKVFFFEDIAERPLELLRDICDYLGVTFDEAYFPHVFQRENEGVSVPISASVKARVYDALAEEYDALEDLFPAEVARWRAAYV